jgi:hypothetical protein
MNRLSITIALATLIWAGSPRSALAQYGGMGSAGAEGQLKNAQPDIGVRLSESSILHLGVVAEAGYDTNVFYNDNVKVTSAVLRVTPSILMTNAGREGEASPRVVYSLGASLLYREYLNDDENVRAQRGFNPTVSASLATSSPRGSSVALADQFSRTEDPPYQQGLPLIIRDYNLGTASFRLAPGGGRIAFEARYTNALDYYESGDYSFASNMAHGAMLDISWKWLPKTALFLQGNTGYVHYLNSTSGINQRSDSVPLGVSAGLRGLVTPKIAVSLGAGYATAFYQNNALEPSGLSNLSVTADLIYRPILTSSLGLGYMHGFRNSAVIGTYYDVDSFGLGLNQLLGRVAFGALGRFEYRRYHGTPAAPLSRKDNIFTAGASLDVYIQQWFYAGVAYSIALDKTSDDMPAPGVATGIAYTKQQILGRVGVMY